MLCTQAEPPAHLQMYSLGMLGSCLLKITLRPINLTAVQSQTDQHDNSCNMLVR